MVPPFIRRVLSWLTGAGKLGNSVLARWWASRRAEKLVAKYGVDRATEITRLGIAMCAEPPTADKLLPAPRQPPDEVTGGYVIVGTATVELSEQAAIGQTEPTSET